MGTNLIKSICLIFILVSVTLCEKKSHVTPTISNLKLRPDQIDKIDISTMTLKEVSVPIANIKFSNDNSNHNPLRYKQCAAGDSNNTCFSSISYYNNFALPHSQAGKNTLTVKSCIANHNNYPSNICGQEKKTTYNVTPITTKDTNSSSYFLTYLLKKEKKFQKDLTNNAQKIINLSSDILAQIKFCPDEAKYITKTHQDELVELSKQSIQSVVKKLDDLAKNPNFFIPTHTPQKKTKTAQGSAKKSAPDTQKNAAIAKSTMAAIRINVGIVAGIGWGIKAFIATRQKNYHKYLQSMRTIFMDDQSSLCKEGDSKCEKILLEEEPSFKGFLVGEYQGEKKLFFQDPLTKKILLNTENQYFTQSINEKDPQTSYQIAIEQVFKGIDNVYYDPLQDWMQKDQNSDKSSKIIINYPKGNDDKTFSLPNENGSRLYREGTYIVVGPGSNKANLEQHLKDAEATKYSTKFKSTVEEAMSHSDKITGVMGFAYALTEILNATLNLASPHPSCSKMIFFSKQMKTIISESIQISYTLMTTKAAILKLM